jgi:hypothetical protein
MSAELLQLRGNVLGELIRCGDFGMMQHADAV